MNNLLDHPLVLSRLFHPQRAPRGTSSEPNAHDGTLPAADPDVELGYRLFLTRPDSPLILFFHGNGEVAAEYDFVAPLFAHIGLSLLVIDYRGYGWSSGTPLGSRLLPDAEAIVTYLPALFARHHLPAGIPLWAMGRSLGGASAVHIAYTFPHSFKGVILESAFSHTPSLLTTLGLPRSLVNGLPDPWAITQKIAQSRLPLMVIHGERDQLVPIENAERIMAASPAHHKNLIRIPGAGHNDLLLVGADAYFGALADFIRATG